MPAAPKGDGWRFEGLAVIERNDGHLAMCRLVCRECGIVKAFVTNSDKLEQTDDCEHLKPPEPAQP